MGWFGGWFGSQGGSSGTPVATPVLAVADAGDGTGGTATVSGATAGTTNTLYSQLVGSSTWVARGSRTGDGTIAISPNPGVGFYWWKVVSTDGTTNALSNVVFRRLTDTALTTVGPITPKIVQLENMLAASAAFQAAIGVSTAEEAKLRIHYSYAIMGEEGSDPSENLDKLNDQLPFAVILSHEQLNYAAVSWGAKHCLRAEGSMGVLLVFKDEVTGQDIDSNKDREILMSNFHGQVMDEVADQAAEEDCVPIDAISMDVPPMRSHPFTDAANDATRGELVPYYVVGYAVHWK